ncbi:MAG: LCP family protein [Jaaginema sp. PMC 1079.18]|nr:LCP family protein [Jaaginema sp. PMC 1080.18]MEC4850922.1 LCP family protein [Jaaginema sp. PMC 1079.18]MEC4864506.1 LCP family protein [Jaaginema sp. PMC 1078.18]
MSVQKVQDQNRRRKKPLHPTTRQKQRSRQKKRRWALIWLGLTAVATLSASAGALLAFSLSSTPLRQANLSPEEAAIFEDDAIATQNLKLPALTRPVHILVIGTKVTLSDLDEKPAYNPGYDALVNSLDGLADTLLLLRFDPGTDRLTILSIPRDTRTLIENYGVNKINAANHYGGPALTAKTVSNLLEDVQIDRYVRVNVQAIEKLIDAIGGVEVYVPRDMKYTDHSQHLYIDLKQGQQTLNGDQALQFLRFRKDEYGDIGRVQRQQMLLRAMIEQALKPSIVVRTPKILKVIQENLDTNLSVEELAALAGFASQTERSQVEMMLLPGEFNGTGRQDISYWIPHPNAIETMMAQHFDHGYSTVESKSPAYTSIAIQDSTEDPGAAANLKEALREAGYPNVYIDQHWTEPLETTRIVAQQGDRATAENVKIALGFGEVRVESTGVLNSDITIKLGQDWLDRQDSLDSTAF